jgi:hypothetical protein
VHIIRWVKYVVKLPLNLQRILLNRMTYDIFTRILVDRIYQILFPINSAQSIMPMPVQVQPPPQPHPPQPQYTPGGLPPSLPHGMGGPPVGGAAAGGALPMDPGVAAALAAMQQQHLHAPSGQPIGPSPIGGPSSNVHSPAPAIPPRPEPIRTKLPEIPQTFPKLDSLTYDITPIHPCIA